jgi:hypothetical protein
LPTTAGVGVGDVTAPEADIDTDAIGAEDAIGGVVGFTDPDTDAIGVGVGGLAVFASQHLDSLHNEVMPSIHLTSIATSCFDGGHLVYDEQ